MDPQGRLFTIGSSLRCPAGVIEICSNEGDNKDLENLIKGNISVQYSPPHLSGQTKGDFLVCLKERDEAFKFYHFSTSLRLWMSH